jgi:hypothetical protein
MNFSEFKESLSNDDPPQDSSVYLKALWYDANGDWEKAHKLIQDIDDKTSAWIHAYLHRKEKDVSNAKYWYKRAGKELPLTTLEKEWEQIVTALQ